MDSARAKTARGRRFLAKREPKLQENRRTALVARGQKSSAVINELLKDVFLLKKPTAVHFTRHNAVHPWEDASPLEFLCQKNDASLFAFGTHSKKRPHNLVLGRMYDYKLLDMYEFGVVEAAAMAGFAKGGGGAAAESKPMVLFHGDGWEHVHQLGEVSGAGLAGCVVRGRDCSGRGMGGGYGCGRRVAGVGGSAAERTPRNDQPAPCHSPPNLHPPPSLPLFSSALFCSTSSTTKPSPQSPPSL
jgi:ribosome production factor 2